MHLEPRTNPSPSPNPTRGTHSPLLDEVLTLCTSNRGLAHASFLAPSLLAIRSPVLGSNPPYCGSYLSTPQPSAGSAGNEGKTGPVDAKHRTLQHSRSSPAGSREHGAPQNGAGKEESVDDLLEFVNEGTNP